MKATFRKGTVTLHREAGDPTFYGIRQAKGEQRLLYHAKKLLNASGFDLVKVRAWKDGHLVDDCQPYLRPRRLSSQTPHVYIISSFFAIRGANDDWNTQGHVHLALYNDVWKTGQDTWGMIEAICAQHEKLTWEGRE